MLFVCRNHMQNYSKKKLILKSTGHILVGLGLISLGVTAAPMVPQAQYVFENAKVKVLDIAEQIGKKINPPINRLPINADRKFTLKNTSQALSLVGQVQTAASRSRTDEEFNLEKFTTPSANSNRIVIPKIGVDMPIVEGRDAKSSLLKGAWRIPGTKNPKSGGNMVISAHRYLYTNGPKTFYHLDKLEMGDEFMIYWEGIEYRYRVTESMIVPPTKVEILDNTAAPRVTLFTCDPIFTSKNRLIKIGIPI